MSAAPGSFEASAEAAVDALAVMEA